MTYDYVIATLARVPTPHQALAAHLRGVSAEVVRLKDRMKPGEKSSKSAGKKAGKKTKR